MGGVQPIYSRQSILCLYKSNHSLQMCLVTVMWIFKAMQESLKAEDFASIHSHMFTAPKIPMLLT